VIYDDLASPPMTKNQSAGFNLWSPNLGVAELSIEVCCIPRNVVY